MPFYSWTRLHRDEPGIRLLNSALIFGNRYFAWQALPFSSPALVSQVFSSPVCEMHQSFHDVGVLAGDVGLATDVIEQIEEQGLILPTLEMRMSARGLDGQEKLPWTGTHCLQLILMIIVVFLVRCFGVGYAE